MKYAAGKLDIKGILPEDLFENTIKAGEKLAIDVVLKNIGYEQLDDLFVIASIVELGTSKKAYFEDLMPEDDPRYVTRDRRDSAERTIYLSIPENAEAGVYDLRVEVYNSDVKDVVTRKIAVLSNEQSARVIVPVTSKSIAVDSTESFDLIIVNSGNNIGVYEIIPEVSDGIIVSADKPIVTIRAGSSETVKLNVKALKAGTFKIEADVESDGNLVKKVSLSAVAEKQKQAFLSSNAVVLTIVLVIVLVVLLVVLIVLLVIVSLVSIPTIPPSLSCVPIPWALSPEVVMVLLIKVLFCVISSVISILMPASSSPPVTIQLLRILLWLESWT